MPTVDQAIPVFFVKDARHSIEWYTRVLGFRLLFDHGGYAGIAFDDAHIHLAQREAEAPDVRYKAGCYLRLHRGVDDYVKAIVAAGQALAAQLSDHPDYGMREATVRDPDGNDIYIGQPL
jgi:catechol 2,3-dioxygenase-like lactoylglutathione lyase family enzyme